MTRSCLAVATLALALAAALRLKAELPVFLAATFLAWALPLVAAERAAFLRERADPPRLVGIAWTAFRGSLGPLALILVALALAKVPPARLAYGASILVGGALSGSLAGLLLAGRPVGVWHALPYVLAAGCLGPVMSLSWEDAFLPAGCVFGIPVTALPLGLAPQWGCVQLGMIPWGPALPWLHLALAPLVPRSPLRVGAAVSFVCAAAVLATLGGWIGTNGYRGGGFTGCQSNLRNLGTALEMYSTDHSGRYPARLADTTYLRAIPTCPVAEADTYSAGFQSASNPDAYTLVCTGWHHQAVDAPPNYPQYDSVRGLVSK